MKKLALTYQHLKLKPFLSYKHIHGKDGNMEYSTLLWQMCLFL